MVKFKPINFGGFGLPSVKKGKRSLGRRDRDILYIRAKCKCQGCGKKLMEPEMQVGHKKAYSKGGATTLANSVCLCYTCNKNQGTDSFETFIKKMKGTYGTRGEKTVKKPRKPTRKKQSNAYGLPSFELPKYRF